MKVSRDLYTDVPPIPFTQNLNNFVQIMTRFIEQHELNTLCTNYKQRNHSFLPSTSLSLGKNSNLLVDTLSAKWTTGNTLMTLRAAIT